MKLQELMDILYLEEPEDFEYFEQLADLLEYEDDIPFDIFYSVLSRVEGAVIGEILENYLEEISDNLPDYTTDLFTLVETIKQRLLLLAENLDDPTTRRSFIEELYRFRQWYIKPDAASVDGVKCSLLEAITFHRAEKLGEDNHKYDFEDCLDYQIEEISMSLGEFDKIDVLEEED